MRSILFYALLLVLTGCADEVTTRFANLADAKSAGAFKRGWLPPVLPDSAKAIVEINDLDSNKGTGAFDYDLEDRATYTAALARLGAASTQGRDGLVLTLTVNGIHWTIQLAKNHGHGEWTVESR